jgi:predicted nucleic acid-binding protein
VILVDTSIWVVSTRHKDGPEAKELGDLIDRDEVATTDVVIAEVLQGTANEAEFTLYKDKLSALHYFHSDRSTWERAAQLSFDLRRRGLPTPLADLVIATVALDNGLSVYARDDHFGRIPGLTLHP